MTINNDTKGVDTHDLIIVGAGPAGLTAGLYAARDKQDVILLEKLSPGGQVLNTDWVENYSGFPEGISGFELMDRMKTHAEKFGLTILNHEVKGVDFQGSEKHLVIDSGSLNSRCVILAPGAQPRKLGIEGESRFMGKGVSYCGTCDGPFYRDATVAVIGGGDTAVKEALFLTRFAKRVYIVHRRDELRATKILQDRAFANKKIRIVWDTVPTHIEGKTGVEALRVKNVKTGETSSLDMEGVFIFVGTQPVTKFLNGGVDLDEEGFIKVNRRQETNVPGIFAAGDVTSESSRQIATAVGEGASAVLHAEKYLETLKH